MQQIIKGKESLLQIPSLLAGKAVNEILFVTGHHVVQDKVFQSLLSTLAIPYRIVHPPEGVLQVNAIPAYNRLETVIAIGGGKVIDYAKGILYNHQQSVLFIAVPTTAGSGSEATPIAVFYNGKEKVSLDAPQLLPEITILDTSLVIDLPPYQKAVSGADALAQSIESIWNVHSNDLSETYALSGLQLLWKELPLFVERTDEEIAERMLWAAHLAGRAITITRTTGPHALSYYLTANFDVPHGQAVALTLPLFFLYNKSEHTSLQFEKIFNAMQVKSADEAFAACRRFMQQIGLATTLKELGLQEIDLDEWLRTVNQQRFANNPVLFDAHSLKNLFQRYLC